MLSTRTVKRLPSSEELVEAFPISDLAQAKIRTHRREIRDLLAGRDSRLLVVVGPCSAWPAPAVLEYARRLAELEKHVSDSLKLVLRVYIQKPRTTRGWTGPVNQPDPFGAPDIAAGMRYAREMMVKVAEMGLPLADEALFTHNAKGFLDLLSWVAIGARSSEDQEHRIWASAIEAPVGMKNPTSGCIPVGINSVLAAQHPHTGVFDGFQVETSGNPYAHLVLRGGANGPNYHLTDLYKASELLEQREILNPAILVDASHENARINGRKDPHAQIDVVREVLSNLDVRPNLRRHVKGFLLESYLRSGCQQIADCTRETVEQDGLSITDPCLGWDATEALILDMSQKSTEMRPLFKLSS